MQVVSSHDLELWVRFPKRCEHRLCADRIVVSSCDEPVSWMHVCSACGHRSLTCDAHHERFVCERHNGIRCSRCDEFFTTFTEYCRAMWKV